MGQQLAKINMPTVIAMLVREFHLTIAPQVMPISLSYLGLSFKDCRRWAALADEVLTLQNLSFSYDMSESLQITFVCN